MCFISLPLLRIIWLFVAVDYAPESTVGVKCKAKPALAKLEKSINSHILSCRAIAKHTQIVTTQQNQSLLRLPTMLSKSKAKTRSLQM
jgi:hypothetical protein